MEEIASQSVQQSKNPQHQLRRFNLLLIIRRCHFYSSIYSHIYSIQQNSSRKKLLA